MKNEILFEGLNNVLNVYFYGLSIGFIVSIGITLYYVTKSKFER